LAHSLCLCAQLVDRIIIIIKSPVVRAVCSWALAACKPPNPVHFVREPEEAARLVAG